MVCFTKVINSIVKLKNEIMKQLLTVVFILSTFASIVQAQMSPIEEASLFQRLGGTEGITNLVDDIVQAHMENPAIQDIFLPYKEQPKRLAKIKQHTVDFFSAGSGGPAKYKGRDMSTTHKGMNTTATQYMHVVDDILMVLDNHKMSDQTKKDVLFITWSLKYMIIGK